MRQVVLDARSPARGVDSGHVSRELSQPARITDELVRLTDALVRVRAGRARGAVRTRRHALP